MGCLRQITLHRFPVSADGIRHGPCRRPRGGKQCLDKTNGFVGIQLNPVALVDDLAGDCASVGNDESRHRTSFNGRRALEKLLIGSGNSGDEPQSFLLFHDCTHARNVCRTGIHCKRSLHLHLNSWVASQRFDRTN